MGAHERCDVLAFIRIDRACGAFLQAVATEDLHIQSLRIAPLDDIASVVWTRLGSQEIQHNQIRDTAVEKRTVRGNAYDKIGPHLSGCLAVAVEHVSRIASDAW